ncbi:hypothetical protein SAMN07250955_10656 [Arboricoccus pini]|uniref:Uncharacterized protein n=1 Tax=Arboricoccus pini TaxID=1963835 RepID=A0A212R6L7_9PROT|nr:hypothetical protein [Arboricoccus pini]SNB67804.1 hypothetical protein SAMN07250955_10656 [Arboricoccus pini]
MTTDNTNPDAALSAIYAPEAVKRELRAQQDAAAAAARSAQRQASGGPSDAQLRAAGIATSQADTQRMLLERAAAERAAMIAKLRAQSAVTQAQTDAIKARWAAAAPPMTIETAAEREYKAKGQVHRFRSSTGDILTHRMARQGDRYVTPDGMEMAVEMARAQGHLTRNPDGTYSEANPSFPKR